jgi:hypothetical protein
MTGSDQKVDLRVVLISVDKLVKHLYSIPIIILSFNVYINNTNINLMKIFFLKFRTRLYT